MEHLRASLGPWATYKLLGFYRVFHSLGFLVFPEVFFFMGFFCSSSNGLKSSRIVFPCESCSLFSSGYISSFSFISVGRSVSPSPKAFPTGF